MKFILLTLITHITDPVTGRKPSTQARFRQVVDTAVLAEELGYDGFAVGERHERPFISSAPTVVLSHLAARTQRIRLFTGVTTFSLLDPVRAFEDYATLDHLAQGRLDLIIGKGNGTAQRDLFNITEQDQWDRNRESYEVFRSLWQENRITWEGSIRPPLNDAEVWPQPLQENLRVWHGSATSTESVDLAVKYGEPIFSANVTYGVEPYQRLVEYYREQWEAAGWDPADARVGAGSAACLIRPTSQEAKELYRPVFEARYKDSPIWPDYDEFLENSSALIGSPAQVVEKILKYHEALGHEVMHTSADADGLTPTQHRESLELFQAEVAPQVRKLVPSRPLGNHVPPVKKTAPVPA